MADATAIVTTESGSRLINRLCRHWSHRFEVEHDDSHGHVDFGESQCSMSAHPEQLVITVHAGEEELEGMQNVVAEHLQRMAGEERLEVIWR
ncbi:hypothetical protein C7446_2002 [Kushneria sinocarnis]|uniref:DUF2218 domain-containing protein n=1 Tax=Kushneria sinocarnis TaxID=595502 RepID=A0A420WWH7_9GAMM|nr:DUF2218 domain-containing protein [Kushneria sinocarnis]RKR03477.1 hypothetical protein C7446_2002 [Kushneria sinocarnis]